MRIKFFAIPALEPDEASIEISNFLASHRILTVDREFIADGHASHWAICVTYIAGKQPSPSKRPKVDYRERLTPVDFALFTRLRGLRKKLAESEGVPVYALFTNEQLATIVTERIVSPERLAELAGVGPARVEKYGQAFIDELKRAPEDAPT